MFYDYNARCNAEVIVEVEGGQSLLGCGRALGKTPSSPEAGDNCMALHCTGRPLVTRLLGPMHCNAL